MATRRPPIVNLSVPDVTEKLYRGVCSKCQNNDFASIKSLSEFDGGVNMNPSVQLEIKNAIWQTQRQPSRTIMRQVCLICKHPLKEWDVQKGKAVCWYCRKRYWPTPKAPEPEANNNICPLLAVPNRKQTGLEGKVSYQPKGFHFTKMHYPRHYKPRTFYRTRETRKHFMDTKIQYQKPIHYVLY